MDVAMKSIITILLVVAATSASATSIRYTSTADLEQQISFDDGKDHSDIREELDRRTHRDQEIHDNYHHSIGDGWIDAPEHG